MKTANISPNVELITHIVMPDHFHALFIIKQKSNQRYIPIAQDENHMGEYQYAPVGADNIPMGAGDVPMDDDNIPIEFTFPSQFVPLTDDEINDIRKMPHSPTQTVGAIVRGFKSSATKQINILRATPQMPVWQRNYHEHIITSERFFNNVANYIL
jgi:hypothetical protein